MTVNLGDPRDTDSLGRYMTVAGKATGGGSAIAAGRVVFFTETAGATGGNVTIATAGSTGPFGVIPNVYPLNADADSKTAVLRGNGCEVYVEANGAIEPNARVVADTGGKVKQIAAEAELLVVGTYIGHEGEGRSLDKPITDAAAADKICIRLSRAGA